MLMWIESRKVRAWAGIGYIYTVWYFACAARDKILYFIYVLGRKFVKQLLVYIKNWNKQNVTENQNYKKWTNVNHSVEKIVNATIKIENFHIQLPTRKRENLVISGQLNT